MAGKIHSGKGWKSAYMRFAWRDDLHWMSIAKVAEQDRVYGKDWISLLMKGRATLATEGGATVFDFDESIEKAVRHYQHQYPHATNDDNMESNCEATRWTYRPQDNNAQGA